MTDVAESFDMGLVDFFKTGWFQGNQLYPGFPILPEDVVLDAGCGDGGHAAFAGRQGAHVVVCDILPEKVAKSAELVRKTNAREVTEVVTTSERLALPNDLATKVICTEVLEHVDYPHVLLSELVRVARPGAVFAITVPDPASESLQKLVAKETYWRRPNHLRVFSFKAIEDLVREAGLVIERHDRYGFYSAIFLAFYWLCEAETSLTERDHPLLHSWADTWRILLDTPGGLELKKKLDSFLPSSQMIIARKPA
jgi:SAM-dependent methyltransferase